MNRPTLSELLKGKTITNAYDGRADGSILIRLDDRTEICINQGNIISANEDDEIYEISAPRSRGRKRK